MTFSFDLRSRCKWRPFPFSKKGQNIKWPFMHKRNEHQRLLHNDNATLGTVWLNWPFCLTWEGILWKGPFMYTEEYMYTDFYPLDIATWIGYTFRDKWWPSPFKTGQIMKWPFMHRNTEHQRLIYDDNYFGHSMTYMTFSSDLRGHIMKVTFYLYRLFTCKWLPFTFQNRVNYQMTLMHNRTEHQRLIILWPFLLIWEGQIRKKTSGNHFSCW